MGKWPRAAWCRCLAHRIQGWYSECDAPKRNGLQRRADIRIIASILAAAAGPRGRRTLRVLPSRIRECQDTVMLAMEEPLLTLAELYPTTLKHQPRRDKDWRVIEAALPYAERMRSGPLASWPQEVLMEWLHRHANHMEDYAFLGFERLRFERVTWPTDRIPGSRCFQGTSNSAATSRTWRSELPIVGTIGSRTTCSGRVRGIRPSSCLIQRQFPMPLIAQG